MISAGTSGDFVTARTMELFAELRAKGHGEIADSFDKTLREIERLQRELEGQQTAVLQLEEANRILLQSNALYAARAAQPSSEGRLTLDNDRQVFFYEQDHYYLSNFSAFSLYWEGQTFGTSEAAYHWEKFPGARCVDVRHHISHALSAHEAFKQAEANKYRRRSDWDDVKVGIMRRILRAKAAQHEYVRRKLLQTGDRELIENSWRDDYWGWGPNRDGQNMLGKLWMEVRAELRAFGEATTGNAR